MGSNNRIKYNVDFDVNQQQLQALQNELTKLQKLTTIDLMKNNPKLDFSQASADLKEIQTSANQIQGALAKAFNVKLNITNFSTLQKEIKSLDLDSIYKSFQKAGSAGVQAFNQIPSAIMKTNLQLKQSHTLLDSMATTMTNTVKWGVTSRIFNEMASSVQEAWTFTKELDTSLNNIRIVTGKSADEMERFARVANNAAQNLGKSTKDYTDAALIYYQQGLSDIESQKRAEITLKASNVTGQSTDTVSEQLTAVWNGYKVATEQAEMYVDKLAAVAADTAADLEELSVGMSKVASAANIMGVDIDQLSATLATVISVTRQAPESVGTAFKTIYARMGDIQAGIDTETSLDAYTQDMLDIGGINVLDANNELRDMGEVIEEVGNKWSSMTREQQIALSQVMAGTRQYNNLLSLFDNWDMYTDALETSRGSLGELNKQQDIYMESTEAKLEQLSTAWERVFDAFVDTDSVNGLIELLTGATTGVANLVEAIGGGAGVLMNLGAIGTQVFSKQIASSINISIKNMNAMKENAQQLQGQLETLLAVQNKVGVGKDAGLDARIIERQKLQDRVGYLDNNQIQQGNDLIDAYGTAVSEQQAFQQKRNDAVNSIKTVLGDSISDEDIVDVFNEGSDASGKFGQALEDNRIELDKYTESLEKFLQAQEDYNRALKNQEKAEINYGTDSKQAKNANQKRRDAGTKLGESFKDVRKNMSKMANTTGVSEEVKKALQETNKNMQNIKAPGQSKEALKELAQDTKGVAQDIEAAIADINNDFNNLENNVNGVTKDIANGLEEKLGGAVEGAKEKLDGFFADADREALIDNITRLTSGFMQIGSALMNVTNIGDIIKDENLTTWEKFSQILMNLTISIPMFLNGCTLVTAAMPKLAVSMGAVKAGTDIASLGFKQATVAVLGFQTALGPLWLVLLAVMAVVGVAVGVFTAWSNANNASAESAKQAAAALEEMKTQLEEATTAAEELKASIEGFEDATLAIDDLREGTEEYNKAIQSANEQAKELIKTLDLLPEQYYYDGRGAIQFKEGVLDDAQAKADQKVADSEATVYVTEIVSNEADLDYQTDKLAEKIGMVSSVNGVYKEGSYWSDGGWGQRELTPESIQGIVDGLSDTDALIEQFGKELSLLTDEELKQAILSIEGITPAAEQMVNAIVREREGLEALVVATQEATTANLQYAKELSRLMIEEKYGSRIRDFNTDENGIFNEQNAELMTAILNNVSVSETDVINNKLNEYSDKINKINSNSELGDFLWNELDQIKGIDWAGDDDEALALEYARTIKEAKGLLTYTKDDGGFGRGSVTDSQGNKIVDQVDDNVMRKALAVHYAKEYIRKDMSDEFNLDQIETSLETMVTKASKLGEQYGTDFSTAMLSTMANKSGEFDFSSLFAEINPTEMAALRELSGEELMSSLGVSSDLLQQMGLEDAEAFKTAFQQGFAGWTWDMDSAIETAMSNFDNEIESLGLSKTKTAEYSDEVKQYAENLMVTQQEQERFNESADGVANSLEYNADAAVKVAMSVVKMNKAIDTLADNMEDWSSIIKKSADTSQESAEAYRGVAGALADIYNTESDYISNSFIQDHLSEIEKIAKGDAEAIENLRDALSEDILINIIAINKIDDTQLKDDLLAKLQEVQDLTDKIEVGAELNLNSEQLSTDEARIMEVMQQIVNGAQMTKDQANALFAQIGFDAEFETEMKPVDKWGTSTITQTRQLDSKNIPTITDQDGNVIQNLDASSIETFTTAGTPYKYQDYVEVVAMGTTTPDGKGRAPKIKSLTKTGTGSMNNYSSSNAGGKAPGSSKSGSSKKPQKMDKVDKKPDRYHKVDTQLTKIGNQLDKIQSQEKKFTGAKLIANINDQLDQLDDRIDRLREKQQIAYGEADELRQKLAGQGVQFNDDGTISNYMQIYESKVAYVNSLIDKYNAMSAEEQEAYKETVEQAKEDLDKFTEELDRYDELVSDFIPGIQQEIQDAIDEQIELNIKKFNMEFDVRLNMKEATKDWNEFKKTILDGIKEDDIYGNAAARVNDDFTNMIGENGVQASTKQAEEVLAELKEMDATGWSDVYGDDRVSALEDLKTAYETINEDLMEINQIQKDVHQAWLDTMNEINEKMADQVSMYEQISNLIEHDMKVIELVYGETDYEALGKYFEKQHQNNLGLLDFQRQNAEFWENEMNSIDKEADPDAWKIARDNWISAVNDLNATVEASIENARDKMENAIDDVFDKFNDQITDGKGLDYLAQQWDLVNDVADDYLDTVNAAFGIRQLESKYQDAIDATDNVSAQRKLNALMEEELNALREKDKLTEYDIERANMKYEIALKQIALEEAQQTKTTMRLRRDSQGNYRYEYIADEDEIAKLQDELEILENELYNFDKERWIEMQNQVVDAVQERQDAIKEILMDASLSEEERAERLAEINRLYNEKIQNITDQTVTAQNNLYQSGADELSKIWDEQGQDFAELSAEEQRILTEEMLPQFETGVNEMIDKFSGPGGFEEMTTGSMDALSQVTQDYNQDLQDIEQNAGIAFDEVEDGVDKNIPKTEQLIEDNDALNAEYEEQIQRIKDLNTQLDNQIKKYQGIADAAKQATQEAYKYWQEQQRQAADAAEKEKQKSSGSSNNTNNNPSNNTTTNTTPSGGSSGSGDGNLTVGESAIYIGGTYYYDSNGTSPSGSRGPGRKVKITAINNGAKYPIHVQSTDSAYGWLRKDQLSGYDTGGYTGDWAGDYGKLAMLHSKELVLNAHDTENMLDMMQIARDVIASSGPRVGALNAGRGADAATTQLEQNVHIEANFPNVESASEIEEALNNLVQLASQRATRNTRG